MADYSFDVTNSGAVDVDSDVHLDGLDDIKVETTLRGGTAVTSQSEVTLHSDGSARVTLDPVTSTSAIAMDLEPVAVDSCLRVELAPVAPTMVRSPWEQRVGLSVWGVELAAISWCGEATTYVEPAPAHPHVIGPAQIRTGHHDSPQHPRDDRSRHPRDDRSRHPRDDPSHDPGRTGGVQIRVGP